MRYLALVLFAAIIAAISGQGCAKQDAIVAHVTVDMTFDALSTAYSLESAKVEIEQCEDYECVSVYDCPSLDSCPAQKELTKRWEPVWVSYEMLATAVELGDSDAARGAYCKLRVSASTMGIKLPMPAYEC